MGPCGDHEPFRLTLENVELRDCAKVCTSSAAKVINDAVKEAVKHPLCWLVSLYLPICHITAGVTEEAFAYQ